MDPFKRELSVRASILYYELDKTQSEIANELGISRSYVSQLLNSAKRNGIVEIKVKVDGHNLRMIRMEVDLQRKFPDVRQMYIMRSDSHQFTASQMGKFAAPYILDLIKKANVIGVGVGHSVAGVMTGLENENFAGMKKKVLVQMLGGLTSDIAEKAHPHEIIQKIRSRLDCEYYPINCPAVIENVGIRNALLAEQSIKRSTNIWNDIDLAILGLGPADRRALLFSMFSDRMVREIEKKGVCGELNINFFDINGTYVPLLEQNKVSTPFKVLNAIPTKVVVGYGDHKIEPILGALNGGLIDVLFTDSLTAEGINRY